jgi:hypothetical protein
MNRVKYIYLDESPIYPGKYVLRFNENKLPFTIKEDGSYSVFFARLFGLSYAQFLRMCRDQVGAEIVGRGSLYPTAYFDNNLVSNQLVILLNNRLDLLMYEREHPEIWKELKGR